MGRCGSPFREAAGASVCDGAGAGGPASEGDERRGTGVPACFVVEQMSPGPGRHTRLGGVEALRREVLWNSNVEPPLHILFHLARAHYPRGIVHPPAIPANIPALGRRGIRLNIGASTLIP